ncbi:CIC11C00000001693 [Sungouiella intermedia]|uniref:CIC11C00000001693 n=1 Tax=Sungouiella intermedia TaxID=45354 RepID=A0A1L0C3L0_9ASCO|nr:CIC11C00000001693 [[Candida] intermedia]
MLSMFRQLVPRSAFQTRTLVSTSVLMAKTIDADKAKLKQLRQSLKEEKAVLAKLRSQHKKVTDKHKQLQSKRKAEEAEKKTLAKAFKPYRKVTGLNIFIKEKVGHGATIATVGKEWSYLTESEKEEFQKKADAVNQENLKIWKPKPSPPTNQYAAFVKEKWVNDGRDFSEISKELASQWRSLTDVQKSAYAPSSEEKAEYTEKLEAWKAERIKLYKAKETAA